MKHTLLEYEFVYTCRWEISDFGLEIFPFWNISPAFEPIWNIGQGKIILTWNLFLIGSGKSINCLRWDVL